MLPSQPRPTPPEPGPNSWANVTQFSSSLSSFHDTLVLLWVDIRGRPGIDDYTHRSRLLVICMVKVKGVFLSVAFVFVSIWPWSENNIVDARKLISVDSVTSSTAIISLPYLPEPEEVELLEIQGDYVGPLYRRG